jgi:membrane dipeptidase
MDNNLRKKAKELQREAFVVDAHFDLPSEVANRRERGQTKVIEKEYLDQLQTGGFDLIVSAMFIDDHYLPEMGLRRALDQISFLHQEVDESPGQFRLCTTTTQAKRAKSDGEIALFLSLEGADPLQNDIHLLRVFYELGVRGLGLVWSRRNYVGDGVFFGDKRCGTQGGLSPFGVELIEKAEELGMFIDVSHLNDAGFEDVIEVASKPIIASHSNCRSLAGSMRNLTDSQIEAIAKNGGVIGMNSINKFVADDGEAASVKHLVDHVDHIVKIAGIEHVGIGFDLCDSLQDYLSIEQQLPSKDVINTHADLTSFTSELLLRDYSDKDIQSILGENFMRIFKQLVD